MATVTEALAEKRGKPVFICDFSPPRAGKPEYFDEARALDWDFTYWCYASGYDAGDPDARRAFERLLAYARHEGRAGMN